MDFFSHANKTLSSSKVIYFNNNFKKKQPKYTYSAPLRQQQNYINPVGVEPVYQWHPCK